MGFGDPGGKVRSAKILRRKEGQGQLAPKTRILLRPGELQAPHFKEPSDNHDDDERTSA